MKYYVKLVKEKVVELLMSTTQAGNPGKDFYPIFRDDYEEIASTKINIEMKRNKGKGNGAGKDKPDKAEASMPDASTNSPKRDELGMVFVKDPRTQEGYRPEPFEYEIPLDIVKVMIDKKAKFDSLLA